MAIVRWDPFSEVSSMQREMDRLLGRLGTARTGDTSVAWMPRIDVKTGDNEMVVYAEIPGMKPEDVDVEVADGILTIKGERKSDVEETKEGWLIRERSYGMFERSLALPDGVEPEKVTADYKNGLLEVHVPKAPEALKPATVRVPLKAAETKEAEKTEEKPEGM